MVNYVARQQGVEDDEQEDGTKPPRIEIKVTVPSNKRAEVLINYELRAQLKNADAIFNDELLLPLVPSAQVR